MFKDCYLNPSNKVIACDAFLENKTNFKIQQKQFNTQSRIIRKKIYVLKLEK